MALPLNATPVFLLLLVTLWAVIALYHFSAINGFFDQFGAALDSPTLLDSIPFQILNTNGTYPRIDSQLRAVLIFIWVFAGNGSNPEASLTGFFYLGNWGVSWFLVIMETLRSGNKHKLIAFDSILGILVFNWAHPVIMPIYLSLHLLTSPTASLPTRNNVVIDSTDLLALPLSFIIAYTLPITLLSVPPSVFGMVFKQTIMAWYQQWNLYIGLTHFMLAFTLRRLFSNFQSDSAGSLSPRSIHKEASTKSSRLLHTAYIFVFIMGSIPYLTTMTISCTASIWPSLFAPSVASSLTLANILIPPSPFSGRQSVDLIQGAVWIIRWENVLASLIMGVWALALHRRARCSQGSKMEWKEIIGMVGRLVGYTLVGGPSGVAVGLMWERDCFLLNMEEAEGENMIRLE
ncbi:hypothetical protein VE03_08318 [Pseudogymnoascus sp. 23342-1-I1]|nr:hypothetical protein VE03_08318 [Pseudogymnoascus sp. 23342-1-I1]